MNVGDSISKIKFGKKEEVCFYVSSVQNNRQEMRHLQVVEWGTFG